MNLPKIEKSDTPIILAIGSTALVTLGLLSCFAYYNNFGIQIFNYIDLSEAILFFFTISSLHFFVFAIGIVSTLILYPSPTRNKEFTPIKPLRWVQTSQNWFKQIMMVSLAMFSIWHVSIYFLKVNFILYLLIRGLIIVIVLFWLLLSNVELLARRILIFVLIFIFGAYIAADSKANAALESPRTIVLKLTDGTLIKSTMDTVYIGNSKNYHFFFLPKLHNSYIIKNDAVQSTVLSNRY